MLADIIMDLDEPRALGSDDYGENYSDVKIIVEKLKAVYEMCWLEDLEKYKAWQIRISKEIMAQQEAKETTEIYSRATENNSRIETSF